MIEEVMRALFLETERLKLYLTTREDFNEILALRSDRDVMAFIGELQTKKDVEHFLDLAIAYQEKHGFGFCSVFEKESGEFIGQAGLFHIRFHDEQPDIEVGYRLHKKFWGQGYATELTRALLQWGFEHLSVDKLLAFAVPENIASCRVLEKAGMIYQGDTNYRDVDVRYYEIYKADLIELVEYDNH